MAHSGTSKRSNSKLISPYTVIIDTREQSPWTFEALTERHRGRDRPLIVPTKRATLRTGDYSILGMESQIAIERKSIQDIVGTVSWSRDRFIRELDRLNAMQWSCVLVEGTWEEVIRWCVEKTRYSSVALDSSILAFQQRFRGVHWIFRPSRYTAAKTAWKILDRFWRDRQASIDTQSKSFLSPLRNP